jgi:hypothetical protein
MKADGDARAGTCGKLWAAFRLKSADFITFCRFQQLRSTAAEAIFYFSGSPNQRHKSELERAWMNRIEQEPANGPDSSASPVCGAHAAEQHRQQHLERCHAIKKAPRKERLQLNN